MYAAVLEAPGILIDQATADGWTALIQASCQGKAEFVDRLIQAGADINRSTQAGYTALVWASCLGRTDTVGRLIQAGADVNHTDKSGVTALIQASSNGHTESVRRLLQAGADLYHADKDGKTALDYATENGRTKIVQLLNNAVAMRSNLELAHAIQRGDAQRVQTLLGKGIDPNALDEAGNTMLHVAIGTNSARMLDMLLQAPGILVNQAAKDGSSPLHVAASQGQTEIAVRLIQAGADIKATDNNGRTALALASEKGHDKLAQLLTDATARQTTMELAQAIQAGDAARVRNLVGQGADPNALDEVDISL